VPSSLEHICVCICTFKRPQLLQQLLEKLQHQGTDNTFTYSAVVVDNDAKKSGKPIVDKFKDANKIRIEYLVEPEQNIALARNKAVESAQGNYIAFIDDDEYPVTNWLFNLLKALKTYNADGVLGPVKPHYPEKCPNWLVKSRLCERPEHLTGTVLNWGETRTGNALMDRKIFEDPGNRFGREFGRTGGEDIEFFRKAIKAGKTFIWCNEATAYETVLPERWSMEFYSKRYLRIGGLVGEKIRKREPTALCAYTLIKSLGWIVIVGISLPFIKLFGDHLYIRGVAKIAYNCGLISGFIARPLIRYRDE
jgi:succinoglycan biosynthesis protein ExoM